ncbi:VOC family protein [Ponticaulis profundi]|uniref:VOC family protein n=1 Tax=Ponticaulis profundi TaxID=2665222 RepID=A0ABW1SAB2_9PROT
MDKITTFLWFEKGEAFRAAEFYTSLLPNSEILTDWNAPTDNPSAKKGEPLVVEFVLDGRAYAALNGGPGFKPTEAVSFMVLCEDQAEIDRLWAALTADGGEESRCGWCKDRWGFSWQITPRRHMELMKSGDDATRERIMQAMMTMKKFDLAAIEAAAEKS